MDWISGIGRDGSGNLCVKAQGLDGGKTQAPVLKELESLRADLGVTGTVRKKIYLPLHELRVGDTTTREYLDGLGLNAMEANGQAVYEVSTSAGLLVIPAQLLVLATLGANAQLRRVLLRPWGPSFLMSAFAEHGADKLAVRPTPHRMLKLQLEHTAIASKVEWALSYPSAAAAWGSIYRHALDGSFDMTMPLAFATASMMCRPVDGKLLVTRLQLMTITPAEEPHPFAAGIAKRDYLFNEGVRSRPTHGKAAAPTQDKRLATPKGHVASLTDDQWARIEPLVRGSLQSKGPEKPGAPRTHSLREVIDVIRLKLGTPYSWSQVQVLTDKKLVQGATVLLSKLKRRGVWEAVVAALKV
jgi:hypothetical protein